MILHVLGYFFAALIGVSLGLIGGGGSILTVPILVYLFGIDPVHATSYSLFIVGFTSLTGAVNKFKEGLVDHKTAVAFGAASIVSIFLTRHFLVPSIPTVLYESPQFTLTKSLFLLLLFALLMVAAAISMIRSGIKGASVPHVVKHINYPILILYGTGVGILTGCVGAGGGFLIVPALVFICGLEMKRAVGTSLVIIASNSLVGFLGDTGHYQTDWMFLITLTAIGVAGIFVGHELHVKIQGHKLKHGFGWFVLIVGAFIIIRELLFTSH